MLVEEFGNAVPPMRRIKLTLLALNIMNPGKMFALGRGRITGMTVAEG